MRRSAPTLSQAPTQAPPSSPTKAPYRKFDTGQALKLRMRGFTYQEIADNLGIHRSTVHARLGRVIPDEKDLPGLASYREVAAEIFDAKAYQALILTQTPDKVKELNAYQGALTTAILTDKARLIRGEPTQNVSLRSVSEHYTSELQRLQDLRAQLEQAEIVNDTSELAQDA